LDAVSNLDGSLSVAVLRLDSVLRVAKDS
jgi:hypothetical protein